MFEIIANENGQLSFEPLQRDSSPEEVLFSLASKKDDSTTPSVKFWSEFTNYFIESVRLDPAIEELREKCHIIPSRSWIRDFLNEAPFMQGGEHLNEDYLFTQWNHLQDYFSQEVKSFKGSIEEYFLGLNPEIHLVGRVFFHLVENKQDAQFPFAFMATYLANAVEKDNPIHRPLQYALEEYKDHQEKMLSLLASIKRASMSSNLIKTLLDSGEIFNPLRWSPEDARKFLEETPLYSQAGILCRIPNWWKLTSRGVQLSFTLGNKKSSFFGVDSLVNFDIDLSLGGENLSEEEAKKLLDESGGLAFLKGKWVKVDKKNLSEALDKWKKTKIVMKKHQISFHEAMKILAGQKNRFSGIDISDFEVTRGEWLQGLTEKLKNPHVIKSTALSKKFKGHLRPYQHRGFNWLYTLYSLNLGGCLADDMGLGKTIQTLAFLQKIIDKENGTHLLILPASLLSNWVSEICRFSPQLKFFVAHPSDSIGQKFIHTKRLTQKNAVKDHSLIITTYGLVRRTEIFKKIEWDYIILDEAQAIKNSSTSQTKAVKALKCKNRLALTGTPIENQIGDLWSLFDFINPGILGSKTEFQNSVKQLHKEKRGMGKVRGVISPYILRRLKTDKKIISDLPPKIEIKSYSYLSKKQAVQYQKLVDHIRSSLKNFDGIERKGIILSSLMKFKQICNHTDQYLGTGNFNLSGSGKFEKLKNICETLHEKREKVLVFTQFKEIISPLDQFLTKIFEKKGVVLHGGTSIKKRKVAVEKFQSNEYVPYFILSLKAGGTGLNLTAANHVIHFDRWWNPAVENQATDRAFRIGQKKKVVVHKFITKGTLEEKIDKMIEEKTKLFADFVGNAKEIKLTEMSNDEIINLVKMEQGL